MKQRYDHITKIYGQEKMPYLDIASMEKEGWEVAAMNQNVGTIIIFKRPICPPK